MEAYAGVISALRAQGDLTKEKKDLLGELSKVVIMIQQTFIYYLLDTQHCSGPMGNTEQSGKDNALWSRSTMAF